MSLFTVVIPIKAGARAKSRLGVESGIRLDLARAFALDTVTAAGNAELVGRIIAVTDDDADLRAMGVHVLPEARSFGRDDLNSAIRQGRDWAERHHPNDPIAVVPADLAALTGADLDEVLRAAIAHERSYCADAGGSGTTVSTARRPALLEPSYGPESAESHRASGSVPLESVPEGVRLDIDTMADLAEAVRLGLGPNSRSVLHELDRVTAWEDPESLRQSESA